RLLGPGTHRFACRRGARVTLLSLTDRARVSTRGLQYPLDHEWLVRGSRGLSNRATSPTVTVAVRQGRVWAIL
ncbi:MAG: thiamine diphosphokinase, partial [Elusimicrobia bacterium]|nr:thiamine diphosphokinase [Elusimicrobiota bacterium]